MKILKHHPLHAGVLLVAGALLMSDMPAQAWIGGEFGAPTGIPQAWNVNPEDARQNYESNGTLRVQMIRSTAEANILYPGERATFTFQFTNLTDAPIRAAARMRVVQYGLETPTSDVFKLRMFKIADAGSVPVALDIAPGGFQNVSITPPIPARLGGYAILADVPNQDSLFAAALIRTFVPAKAPALYPKMSMDRLSVPTLKRLGIHMVRYGIAYKPTTDADFPQWYAEEVRKIRELEANGVRVMLMWGSGAHEAPEQPLRMPRGKLNDKGVMVDSSIDLAWMPSYDADYQKLVARLTTQLGYPRGPINAMELWNEPWEGSSISGWGADSVRYREIYSAMARGVEAARKTGVRVLTGGGASSSNAADKFFADGTDAFLPRFDFVSIHYQGMQPPTLVKKWNNRQGYGGRVKVWDTESWVGNSEDRVGVVVASNRSTGHDSAMGVYGGNVDYAKEVEEHLPDGTSRRLETHHAWSVGAGIGAAQHFIGERNFKELVFQNGLPFIMQFDGLNGQTDDGTLVVVGDLGATFNRNQTLFRSVTGLNDATRRAALQQQLAAIPPAAQLPEGDPRRVERTRLEETLKNGLPLEGGALTLSDGGGRFKLFDFYGNALPSKSGKITVPLNGKGYFLRTSGTKGSFASLVQTVRAAYISGYEPLDVKAHDLLAPVAQKPDLRLTLTNILNRPVRGDVQIKFGNLKLSGPAQLAFAAHETKVVNWKIVGGAANAANDYPLSFRFNGGRDGVAQHSEMMHANVIARKTITVDGNLDDWRGVLPQTITGTSERTLTEAAWLPFAPFKTAPKSGLASGFAAYDDKYFYFAAKVADDTPEAGMRRYEKLNAADFFYPETAYLDPSQANGKTFAARWTGQIQTREAGNYNFSTESDDGSRVYINDKLVVDNWRDQGATERDGNVSLEANRRYNIRIEYYQGGGGASMRFRWKTPTGAKEIVPTSSLFPSETATEATGLTAEFFRDRGLTQSVVKRVDSRIDFEWKGVPDPAFSRATVIPVKWPQGVRRYSYRREPDLPSGDFPNHDNAQIAFNVLPAGSDDWEAAFPGTPFGYVAYKAVDYEYALNPVAPEYGGGTEVWRLQVPGMPRKQFYPREPKSKFDGAVKGAKLSVRHIGPTRIIEGAMPWSEIPDVQAKMRRGEAIKFAFRINDTNGNNLDFSRGRSASNQNALSFHSDWRGAWAPEIEWGWGK